MIPLFDLENGKVVPTVHCYKLKDLNNVIEKYPEDYLDVLAYIFYMTNMSEKDNPFFELDEDKKEEAILYQLKIKSSLDTEEVQRALVLCKELYTTPVLEAFLGIKNVVHKLGVYMRNVEFTDGKDGNILQLISASKNYTELRKTYNSIKQELEEEQGKARGGLEISYDQR
jgi:hypothetical protein